MGGEGSMLQMINSLRNNKRSRKTLFDQSTKHKGGQTHRKKDIDPNAVAELKLRLKEEKRRRKIPNDHCTSLKCDRLDRFDICY